MENPFSEVMKGQTNAALLAVLRDRERYQAAALEAAVAELSRRNISPEELEQLPAAGRSGVQKRAGRLMERMNPFLYSGVEKEIVMIIVSISYYLFFMLISGYGELVDAIRNFSLHTLTLLTLAPYLLVPPGLYFFHKRDRLGWTILCAWATASLASLPPSLAQLFHKREPGIIGNLFNQPADISTLLVAFLIFGGMLYALNKKPILLAFRVSPSRQLLTILLSAAFIFLLFQLV